MVWSVPPPLSLPASTALPRPRPRAGAAQAGFALPLALVGALVLVLGSLAAQSALHQSRLRHASALGQRHQEDALASAAHRLAGRLMAHHACLLALPLPAWAEMGQVCADATAQARLRQGEGAALAYRLESWEPVALPAAAGGAARLGRIELELSRRSGPGQAPWRAAFALDVQEDPPRLLALRELGLRGVRP